jgi:hypothetical protein
LIRRSRNVAEPKCRFKLNRAVEISRNKKASDLPGLRDSDRQGREPMNSEDFINSCGSKIPSSSRPEHKPRRRKFVSMIHEFVAAHQATLIVGLQSSDEKLVPLLQAERMVFVTFDGAESYSNFYGGHWTPSGHERSPNACRDCYPKTTLPA